MKKQPFQAPEINRVEALTAQLMDANRRLEQANRDLLESEQARREMLANLSHDLRAPLTAVRGALDRLLAAEEIEREERASLVGMMDRRVRALEHLAGELYYSAAIERPDFSLRLRPIPAAAYLEEYFVARQEEDRFARRDFVLELAPDLDGMPAIDPDHFARVLDNLMENALRFTQEGDRIELAARDAPEGVEIRVADGGCGIAAADLPRIFERTYTVSPARSPEGGPGSGLGLHIAKTIVEKHGGSIGCESEPGRGSVFVIRLPACPGDA